MSLRLLCVTIFALCVEGRGNDVSALRSRDAPARGLSREAPRALSTQEVPCTTVDVSLAKGEVCQVDPELLLARSSSIIAAPLFSGRFSVAKVLQRITPWRSGTAGAQAKMQKLTTSDEAGYCTVGCFNGEALLQLDVAEGERIVVLGNRIAASSGIDIRKGAVDGASGSRSSPGAWSCTSTGDAAMIVVRVLGSPVKIRLKAAEQMLFLERSVAAWSGGIKPPRRIRSSSARSPMLQFSGPADVYLQSQVETGVGPPPAGRRAAAAPKRGAARMLERPSAMRRMVARLKLAVFVASVALLAIFVKETAAMVLEEGPASLLTLPKKGAAWVKQGAASVVLLRKALLRFFEELKQDGQAFGTPGAPDLGAAPEEDAGWEDAEEWLDDFHGA